MHFAQSWHCEMGKVREGMPKGTSSQPKWRSFCPPGPKLQCQETFLTVMMPSGLAPGV